MHGPYWLPWADLLKQVFGTDAPARSLALQRTCGSRGWRATTRRSSFAREHVVLELVAGRRALGLLDRELDELMVQGWFD